MTLTNYDLKDLLKIRDALMILDKYDLVDTSLLTTVLKEISERITANE